MWWDAVVGFLTKAPISISLVVSGFAATIWASLRSSAAISGVNIGLESPGRIVVLVFGGVAITAGIACGGATAVALFRGQNQGQSQNQGQQLPVEGITLDPGAPPRVNPPPHAQYQLSGEVTPKTSGITVWLVREHLDHGSAGFSPSPFSTTTDDDGRWELRITMWPGLFRVHAVVTTDLNGSFYDWYGRAREAALNHVREHEPGANSIKGWPNLDSLPEPRRSASVRIQV